tara:strand:- start:78 stop:602 length:525 start_codon:yes stop_codon:yes gene_type:complete
MSIKPIITVPDPILRSISKPIEKITKNENKLIKDLEDSMYNANGIGLAAIQLGIPLRLIVIDVSNEKNIKKPLCFINPVIKFKSKNTSIYEEGCLSIPETFIEIERPKKIIVEYVDISGKKSEMECDGLLSTCIQHEINHCDGKLIIDYLSKLKKDFLIKKLSKQKSKNNDLII